MRIRIQGTGELFEELVDDHRVQHRGEDRLGLPRRLNLLGWDWPPRSPTGSRTRSGGRRSDGNHAGPRHASTCPAGRTGIRPRRRRSPVFRDERPGCGRCPRGLFFELGGRGRVVAAMAGTRHERCVSEFMQQIVDGGKRQAFAEAGFDEVPEIDSPQRAGIVRLGTVLDPLGEQRQLFGVEDLRATASGAILQSGKSFGVVASDPLLNGASGQAALQGDLRGGASPTLNGQAAADARLVCCPLKAHRRHLDDLYRGVATNASACRTITFRSSVDNRPQQATSRRSKSSVARALANLATRASAPAPPVTAPVFDCAPLCALNFSESSFSNWRTASVRILAG
jgi:hypothetical protein